MGLPHLATRKWMAIGFSRSSFDIDSAAGERSGTDLAPRWVDQSVNITACQDVTGGEGRVTCVTLLDP